MRCSQRIALASSTRISSLAMWALQLIAGACCCANDALRHRCRALTSRAWLLRCSSPSWGTAGHR